MNRGDETGPACSGSRVWSSCSRKTASGKIDRSGCRVSICKGHGILRRTLRRGTSTSKQAIPVFFDAKVNGLSIEVSTVSTSSHAVICLSISFASRQICCATEALPSAVPVPHFQHNMRILVHREYRRAKKNYEAKVEYQKKDSSPYACP